MPIDILWGSDALRAGIDAGRHADEILAETDEELRGFTASVEPYQLYD